MKTNLFSSKNVSLLNGILAILFGCIAIIFPGIAIASLAIILAILIIPIGIFLISVAVKNRNNSFWLKNLAIGLVITLLGIIILFNPESFAAFFMILAGLWIMVNGLVLLWMYFRKYLPGFMNVFYLVAGLLSLVTGLLIIINPFESTRLLVILIGVFTIAYGIYSLTLTHGKT